MDGGFRSRPALRQGILAADFRDGGGLLGLNIRPIPPTNPGGKGGLKFLSAEHHGTDAETSGGDIEIVMASDARADVDASTSGGAVRISLPHTAQERTDKDEFRGQINGGGPEVRARTSGGSIRIRAREAGQ